MDGCFEEYRPVLDRFDLFQASLQRPLPVHLRINPLKADPEGVVRELTSRGIALEPALPGERTFLLAPGLTAPGHLPAYCLGYIHAQALTSCLAARYLAPRKESFVLDMCAAPGGKTAHLAALMENTGLIVANELHPARHSPLGHTLVRLGVANALITGYQAQEFPLRQRFDYVLADVPCSGEGRFRRLRPGARHRRGRGWERLPPLQERILLRGFDLLREGGRMLYATCTYNPEENEAVVQSLLEQRPQARILPLPAEVPSDPGLTAWKGRRYDRSLERARRFYPHRVDSVGFFMARIGKRA